MNLFKKLILPLLLLPILFFAASNIQKASAQIQAPHDINVNYILIDKNGNFSKDLGEVCYTGSIQNLKIGSTNTTWTNRKADCALPASRQTRQFTTSTKIPVSILLGNSNYTVTGIKYSDTSTGGAIKQTAGGAVSLDISSKNANVYYFIKPKTPAPEPTCNKDPEFKVTDAKNLKNPDRTVYNLSLKNNDDTGCPATIFDLDTIDLPSGWTTPFTSGGTTNEKIFVQLAAKQTNSSLTLKVQPTANATAKSYPFKIQAVDRSKPASKAVISRTYTVTNETKAPSKAPTKAPTKPPSSSCDTNPPALTVTDPTNKTRSGVAGTTKSYTLKVTNKDTGSNCPARTLVLSKEKLPSDKWTGSFSANNFSLAKGTSKEITFKVTSPTTATTGEKNISVGVKKQQGALVQQALTYIVTPKNSTTTPTKAPTNPPATLTKAPTTPPTSCTRKAPTTVITQDKKAVKPNGTIIYSVTLTNNDTTPCADKKLKLSTTLPNDKWKSTFSKNDLSMKAGTKIAFKLTIDSPNNATLGTKDIKLVVKNNEGTALLTQPLSFIVSENPGTVSPPITPPISEPVTPPPGQALLNFILGLDGIGTTERINIGGNKNPDQTEKILTVQLRNPLNNEIVWDSGLTTFIYDSGKEKYVKSLDLPSSVSNGTYNVFVYGAPYISRRYPVSVNVAKGQATNLNSPQFYMVAGNIDDEGQSKDFIDIRDYNVLMSCSIFSKDTTVCDSNVNFLINSDLNSDGIVDQSDYTLWLKEKSKQKGDLPE